MLRGFAGHRTYFTRRSVSIVDAHPENISAGDFRLLRSRLLSNAFAFAETDSSIQNNTSVVLLIEWRNRRLLFTGDAEWEGEYRDGKHNGSWNVMWNVRPQRLCEPVDFLKIGHHGSHNATPWAKGRSLDYEVNQILNEILPLPVGNEKPSAKAIASTQRTQVYKPIPAAELLEELGKRVSNTRTYYQELSALDLDFEEKQPFEDYWEYEQVDCLKKPQPWRTDLENMLSGVDYVDVEIEAGD